MFLKNKLTSIICNREFKGISAFKTAALMKNCCKINFKR